MFILSKNKEIAVRVREEETDVSALMVISQYPDIEVLVMHSYCEHDGVVLLLVANNTPKTFRILEAAGYECSTNPIVLVGPLGGRGCAVPLESELKACGIRVLYFYSHRTESGLYLVFRTREDDRTLRTLAASPILRSAGDATVMDERYADVGRESVLHQSAA
jgi:hypothetical protein